MLSLHCSLQDGQPAGTPNTYQLPATPDGGVGQCVAYFAWIPAPVTAQCGASEVAAAQGALCDVTIPEPAALAAPCCFPRTNALGTTCVCWTM